MKEPRTVQDVVTDFCNSRYGTWFIIAMAAFDLAMFLYLTVNKQ